MADPLEAKSLGAMWAKEIIVLSLKIKIKIFNCKSKLSYKNFIAIYTIVFTTYAQIIIGNWRKLV
jgi:hypothetical protein